MKPTKPIEKTKCIQCGSKNLQYEILKKTRSSIYYCLNCKDCGKNFTRNIPKETQNENETT